MGMRDLQSKTPEEQAALKFVSFSGFGEKKFYIENIPGEGFLYQGESFLFIELSPLGDECLYRKPSVGEYSLYREPSGGKVFYHFKTVDSGLQISQAKNEFGKFLRSYPKTSAEILWYFVSRIMCQREFLIRSSTVILCTTDEGQGSSEFHLVGLKIVKRLRQRPYDPLITEGTISLCC